MVVVIESPFPNSSQVLLHGPIYWGTGKYSEVEESTFKTYSHLVKCWLEKLFEEWITVFLIILPQLMFCNCFQSEAPSIMANDMTFHTIGIWLYLGLR